MDRVASLFVPQYRYRCTTHLCEWEGNLRQILPAYGNATSGNMVAKHEVPKARSTAVASHTHFDWLGLAIPVSSFGAAMVFIYMAVSW